MCVFLRTVNFKYDWINSIEQTRVYSYLMRNVLSCVFITLILGNIKSHYGYFDEFCRITINRNYNPRNLLKILHLKGVLNDLHLFTDLPELLEFFPFPRINIFCWSVIDIQPQCINTIDLQKLWCAMNVEPWKLNRNFYRLIGIGSRKPKVI
jgi:hypothetical protein